MNKQVLLLCGVLIGVIGCHASEYKPRIFDEAYTLVTNESINIKKPINTRGFKERNTGPMLLSALQGVVHKVNQADRFDDEQELQVKEKKEKVKTGKILWEVYV